MSERPADITPEVREIYKAMRARPGAFLGGESLTLFRLFIDGWQFAHTVKEDGSLWYDARRIPVFFPDGFNEYVAERYHAKIGSQTYCSLILSHEAGERCALEKFWELLDGYLVGLGYEPIPLTERAEEYRHDDGICNIWFTDLELLADSYMRTFNGAPWFDRWDNKTACCRLRDLYRSAGFYGYAIWQDGKPLGAVMGAMERYFDGDVFRIIELWTDPEQRGKGLGRRLLDEMKNWVAARGGVRMYLITLKTTETVGFYEHCGFSVDSGMCVMSLSEDSVAEPTKGE